MPEATDETNPPERGKWAPTPPELAWRPERGLKWLAVALPGVAIATAASIVWWDFDMAAWVHHAPRGLRRAASHVTELGNAGPIVAVAVLAAVLAATARKWALVSNALLLLLALGMTGLINTTFKFVLGRARPSNHVDALDDWSGAGADGFYFFETTYKFMGFPSGHSATAGAIAMVGLLLRPRWWPAWLAYAVVIPATRVLTNAHYVADTLAGAWVGAACGAVTALLWLRLTEARTGRPRLQ